MSFKKLQQTWDKLGKVDPFWAILAFPNKKGRKWQEDEFFKTGTMEISSVMRYVNSLPVRISFGRALDFGCGAGRLTQALAAYFELVCGVDISSSMIKLAEKYNRYPNKCKYQLNKKTNLKIFPDNFFDFVYTNITLQHMEPKYAKNYLKEFIRVIKPKGIIIFQIPSHISRWFLLKKKIENLIKLIVPKKILKLRHKIKYNYPKIEVYGIKKDKVLEFLCSNGGEILDIKQNKVAGEEWISFNYYVTKN